MVDHHDPAAQLLDVGEVVGRQQDRRAALGVQVLEELPHLDLGDHVQPDRRLVQVQHLRIMEQRGRDVAAHPLPQRELPYRDLQQLSQVQEFHAAVQVLPVTPVRDAVHAVHQPVRVAQREVPPERRALAEDDADAVRQPGPLPGRVDAGDAQPAAARSEDAGQHLDRGRLPGPVRTDVADHLTARDAEADPVHGPHLAALGAQQPGAAADLEDLLHTVEGDEAALVHTRPQRAPLRPPRHPTRHVRRARLTRRAHLSHTRLSPRVRLSHHARLPHPARLTRRIRHVRLPLAHTRPLSCPCSGTTAVPSATRGPPAPSSRPPPGAAGTPPTAAGRPGTPGPARTARAAS